MNTKRYLLCAAALLLIGIAGVFTRQSLHYSATCARCLTEVSGVEKSALGIVYSRTETPHRTLFDPHLYQKITGRDCEHAFIRTGFCRYSLGLIGCGQSGGPKYELRRALIENLYRTFLRIDDSALALESYRFIDQRLPIDLPPGEKSTRTAVTMDSIFQVEAYPADPLSILYRGLPLVGDPQEWRRILDAARTGNASIDLLTDSAILVSRLQNLDKAGQFQIIDQLAALDKPEAWAAVAGCLNDPRTYHHAAELIIVGRRLTLFEAIFRANGIAENPATAAVDEPQNLPAEFDEYFLQQLTPEQIRALLDQQRPLVDRIALAAIRKQNRFEFLDAVLDRLNRHSSAAALVTIDALLAGPDPFGRTLKAGEPPTDPWPGLVATTSLAPVESMTNYTALGQKSYRTMQQVVTLGLQRKPGNWPKLCNLYTRWIDERGAEWWSAAFAQAMAESDRPRTLEFLQSRLDPVASYEKNTATLASLGAIADEASLPLILDFQQKARPPFQQSINRDVYLAYALHRCSRRQHWRLVHEPGSSYSIEKSPKAD
jgi:hypothetical protein